MNVSTARRRLAQRLQEALESGDPERISRTADYTKALGVALAARREDEEVDLAALTVDTDEAAHIMGYHREHVRRLVRQAVLRARRESNQLRIPVASLMAAMEGRLPSTLVPDVREFLDLLGLRVPRTWPDVPPRP